MNFALLDARCFPADPLELPARRLFNLAHAMVLESLMFSDDKETREEILDCLAWPGDAGSMTDAQDRSARAVAASIGFDPEAALARTMAARAALPDPDVPHLTGDLQHDYLDPDAPAPAPPA